MNRTRQTVTILLLTAFTVSLLTTASVAAENDGPIVNDYSNMGADYTAPEQSKSKRDNEAEKSQSSASNSDGKKTASTNSDGKPYKVDCSGGGGCRVSEDVMVGYTKFGEHCARCHGENAQGSTFAPSLVKQIQARNIGQGAFTAAVAGGKTVLDTTTGGYRVMPAWSTNEDVMTNLQQLWAFVKARSDGALKPGRPQPLKQ